MRSMLNLFALLSALAFAPASVLAAGSESPGADKDASEAESAEMEANEDEVKADEPDPGLPGLEQAPPRADMTRHAEERTDDS